MSTVYVIQYRLLCCQTHGENCDNWLPYRDRDRYIFESLAQAGPALADCIIEQPMREWRINRLDYWYTADAEGKPKVNYNWHPPATHYDPITTMQDEVMAYLGGSI